MNTADARQLYQDSAVRGASPIELVVVLYDSAIHDMRRALAAIRTGEVETRANRIAHALIVLQQLQGTLDFERGGSAAYQFQQFYNVIRAKVLEAQMRGSWELLDQQIRYMSEVRECWMEAKRQLEGSEPVPPTNHDQQREGRTEWSA